MLTYSKLVSAPAYGTLVDDGPFPVRSRWAGRGIAAMDRTFPGLAVPRDHVNAAQITALFEHYSHPDSPPGDRLRLGRLPQVFAAGAGRAAVTGHVLDASPPKSVSLLHAFGSQGTRRVIADAHATALGTVISWLEHGIIVTRRSTDRTVPVHGVLAAVFDRATSRALDPHLNTRVLISSCVQRTYDNKWSRIHSRPLMNHVVAASYLYQVALFDQLITELGIQARARYPTPDSPRPVAEVAGVPAELIAEFSTRNTEIFAAAETTAPQRIGSNRGAFNATRPHGRATGTAAELLNTWNTRATTTLGRRIDTDDLLDLARQATTPHASLTPEHVRELTSQAAQYLSARKTRRTGTSSQRPLAVAATAAVPAGDHLTLAKKIHRRALAQLNPSEAAAALLLP